MRHFTRATGDNPATGRYPGPRQRKQSGMVMIVSLIILIVLTLLALTAMRMSVVEELMTGNQKLAAKALFAAEQGVSKAIDDLLDQTISDSGSETDTSWSVSGTVTGTDYSTAYTVSHELVGGAVATTTDGRPYYAISSTGSSAGASRNLGVSVTLETSSPWSTGLVGCDGVTSSSDMSTNSYSSSGQPSSGDQGDVSTTNAGADVDIDSNTDINGDVYAVGRIIMNSNARIRGDANATGTISVGGSTRVNGDARSSSTVSSSSRVDGTVYQNLSPDVVPTEPCDPLDIDSVFSDADDIQSSNDNGELSGYYSNPDYWIGNSDSDTLGVAGQQKDYSMQDFTTDSDGHVTIQGNVRLYVSGDFRMLSNSILTIASGGSLTIYVEGMLFIDSNTTMNDGGTPGNLQIFSDATSSDHGDYKIQLYSNSGFYGAIYAPRAAIEMKSNTAVHGAMRGWFIDGDSNATFSYDEDLGAVSAGPATDYQLVYWNEIY